MLPECASTRAHPQGLQPRDLSAATALRRALARPVGHYPVSPVGAVTRSRLAGPPATPPAKACRRRRRLGNSRPGHCVLGRRRAPPVDSGLLYPAPAREGGGPCL